jgi:hypothetical protein
MPFYNPPAYGVQYIFFMSLTDQTNTKIFKASPTLSVGDVKVSKDGGTLANLTVLPTVTPSGSKIIKVTISATEMQANNISLIFSDVTGSEWCDRTINVQPSKIGDSANTIVRGSVDDSIFAPTASAFEAGDITETTTNHYFRRRIIWTSGSLIGQATGILAYSIQGGKGRFTVETMTEAPAVNDKFIIV